MQFTTSGNSTCYARKRGALAGRAMPVGSGNPRENFHGILCWVIALGVAGWLMLQASPLMAALQLPGAPLIYAAADKLNTIAPQAVPQQTIRVGTFDGSTKQFAWTLPEEYPPNLPAYKRADQGGYVQPDHVAEINSFNIKYEFLIRNKPANFRLTLYIPDGKGQMVEKVATVAGDLASVSFNPLSFGYQIVRINQAGVGDLRIRPRFRNQLGAFVAPYVLVAIVYEPPGSGSTGRYMQTSTANTVVSWGFARTSGMVETVDPERLNNLFIQGMSAGVDKLVPGAGQAIQVIAGLREQTQITTVTSQTSAAYQSAGTSISLSVGFETNLHLYPGQGDRFVVMFDVLFVYLAQGGKISLAPVAFSGALGLTASELQQGLPAPLVAKFLALSPHFNPNVMGQPVQRVVEVAKLLRVFPSRFVKNEKYGSVACQYSGANLLEYAQTDFQSTTRSSTTTETVLTKVTGLAASLGGGGDTFYSTSYFTATQQGTAQTQSTSISLLCDQNQQFWVDVYLDGLFRTFLTVRGEPLTGEASVAGSVGDEQGRPVPNQQVMLQLGNKRYTVLSDQNGNFRFPVRSLPLGSGYLIVGKSSSPITYQGKAMTNQRLIVKRGLPQALPSPATPLKKRP